MLAGKIGIWFPIAILAYFLFAAVKTTDRYLLRSSIPAPIGYTFYVGMLSLLGSSVILLASPFLLGLPFPQGVFTTITLLFDVDLFTILISLVAGALFIWALIGFFS